MTTEEFESLLDHCCKILTEEARSVGFTSSKQFENRVRAVLSVLTADDTSIEIDFNSPAQAFPDIAVGEYGVEVKYTTADTWRSIANSVLETQRVEGVKYIYIVFGKMGGMPEVRWGEYETSVVHVRTSHVPRFEVEIATDKTVARESLFQQMGIRYEDFRQLDMSDCGGLKKRKQMGIHCLFRPACIQICLLRKRRDFVQRQLWFVQVLSNQVGTEINTMMSYYIF